MFGAVDPNSGTAALMSIAKAIGQLRNDYSELFEAPMHTGYQRDCTIKKMHNLHVQ